MTRFAAVAATALPSRLVEIALGRHPESRPLRIALDAPACCEPQPLIDQMSDELAASGRPVAVVLTRDFYRDASLRFEYGKQDVESYYSGWLDVPALQREVLGPLGPHGTGSYLPSMRDPASNRSTREARRELAANGVLILSGSLLLGVGLGLDVAVHFNVSRQARRRIMPPEWAWTLPAYDRYDIDVDPSAHADVVVRYDDPRHPAISIQGVSNPFAR